MLVRLFSKDSFGNENSKKSNNYILLQAYPCECIVKSGTIYDENSTANISSALLTYFSNEHIVQIKCCQIIVCKEIDEISYKFVSPVIERSKIIVEELINNNNGVKIYFDSENKSNYYFDLKFL